MANRCASNAGFAPSTTSRSIDDQPEAFTNLNTAEDLARFEAELQARLSIFLDGFDERANGELGPFPALLSTVRLPLL